jgi:hypothetical protein
LGRVAKPPLIENPIENPLTEIQRIAIEKINE